jgi:type I restriction enzyme R subunit
VVLEGWRRGALVRVNPNVPPETVEESIRKATRPESPSLPFNGRAFHRMIADGVDVSWPENGQEWRGKVWFIERVPARMDYNELLVVNQFTVIGAKNHRRPDVMVFVDGLPLAVIELKNPARKRRPFTRPTSGARPIWPRFRACALLVISDGFN